MKTNKWFKIELPIIVKRKYHLPYQLFKTKDIMSRNPLSKSIRASARHFNGRPVTLIGREKQKTVDLLCPREVDDDKGFSNIPNLKI